MEEVESSKSDTTVEYKRTGLYPLDPLSTILKLCLLYFLPKYTKISIKPCRIFFQQPSLYQGALRLYFGDEKNHLHHLLSPIKNYIEMYPSINDENLQNFTKFAIKGLTRLINSYQERNDTKLLIDALTHYRKLLSESLNSPNSLSINDDINIEDEYKNVSISDYKDKINSLWNRTEIDVVSDLFQILIFNNETNKDFMQWFKSMNTIVDSKEIDLEKWWCSIFDVSIRSR